MKKFIVNKLLRPSLLFGALCFGQLSLSAQCGYIFVDQTAAGANNGSDWTNAFTTVQAALTAANSNCDTILVAAGTYSPGGAAGSTYNLKSLVPMYGGFPNGLNPLTWTWANRNVALNPTILDGNSVNSRVVTANNVGSNAVMSAFDGFTVQGALANGMYILANGAGQVSGPIVRNCTFQNNSGVNGSGVWAYALKGGSATPAFTNVTFTGNTATAKGGGLYLLSAAASSVVTTLDNTVFTNNTAFDPGAAQSRGGGMYSQSFGTGATLTATMNNCSFSNNTSEQWGGGLFAYSRQFGVTTYTINGSTFTNNTALSGGGLANHCQGGGVTMTMNGCTVNSNTTTTFGGGMLNYCELDAGNGTVNLNQTTFMSNLSANAGGALANISIKGGLATVNANRSMFSENQASSRGGAVYAHSSTANLVYPVTITQTQLTNCIFMSNSTPNNGGAVYNESTRGALCAMDVHHCTMVGNSAARGAGVYDVIMSPALASVTSNNSIWWNNTTSDPTSRLFHTKGIGASMAVIHSSLQDTAIANNHFGTGSFTNGGSNIAGDPLFVNYGGGDLHLLGSSACIDAGQNIGVAVDYDGNVRPQGAGYDMGAFERSVGPRPMARTAFEEATSVSLFPNPTTGAFTVSLDREMSGFVQVFDQQGRLVASQQLNGADRAQFDLSGAASGVYLLRIVDGESVSTKQVVVHKP
jgi:predicted outer membrane repeat protein